MKKLISVLLVLVMVLTMVPAVFANEPALTSGKYVLVASNGYALGALDGTWILAEDATNGVDGITAWNLTVDGDTVKLCDANGVYIAPKGGNNNGIKESEYSWSLVANGDGTYSFYGQGSDTVVLASNVSSENKFRGYKTTTVSGYPESYPSAFTLYAVDGGEEPDVPDVPDVPENPVVPETLAEQIAEANKLANGAYLTYESTITGTVTDVPVQSSYEDSADSYRFTVEDAAGNSLLCYYVPVSGGTPAKNDTVTVTGKLTAYGGTAQFDKTAAAVIVEKAPVEEPEVTQTAQLMSALPVAGDIVIIGNSTNIMTATANGTRLAAQTATITEGVLSVTDTMAQLVVGIDENGYYIFAVDGAYLTSGATGNSLTLEATVSDYSLWTMESAGNDSWYIKNVNAKYSGNIQSLEYYNGFTTYGHKDSAIYQMQLYKAGTGEAPDAPVVPEEPVVPETLAEQIAEANKLANGAYLAYESTITGTVTDVPVQSDYEDSADSYKFTVEDAEGNSILCYYVPVTGGVPEQGDTVTVTGKLTAYNKAAQFDKTAAATVVAKYDPSVAAIGNEKYLTVAEALESAKSGDTVVLLKDANEPNEHLFIDEGVTLDLAGYDLTIKSLNALNGGLITGTRYGNEGHSRVFVAKNRLSLTDALVNGQNLVIPYWDPNDGCYVLANTRIKDVDNAFNANEETKTISFRFSYGAGSAANADFLIDGADDNALSVIVRLQWESENGVAYQDFVYKNEYVMALANSGGNFTFELTGYDILNIDLDTFSITGMILSDSGIVVSGTEYKA